MRREHGQAAVDYLAIVLLLAVVFASVVGLLAATGLGAQVVTAMKRALCIVTGGPCDHAQEAAARPCVLAADERSEGGSFTVSIVRIGERNAVLRERRADGTIALTLVDSDALGADLRQGFSVRAKWGDRGFAVGRELRAAVLAEHSDGRTWVVPDDANADEVIAQIRLAASPFADDLDVHAPEPNVTYEERGASFSTSLSDSRHGSGELSARFAYGERRERLTGHRTVYVRDAVDGHAAVSFGDWAAEGDGRAEERFGVTYDREGKPIDLVVLSTLDVRGSVGLPPELAAIAGWLRIPQEGSRHVETERHLDLTDPLSAEAAEDYLSRLEGDRAGLREAARALRERIDALGTYSVRTYASDHEERSLGVHGKVGPLGGGMEVGSDERSSRLVAAVARRPDGSWGEDHACPAAA